MNAFKKISVAGLRLVLLLTAPEFLFSQFLRRQLPYRPSKRASEDALPGLTRASTKETQVDHFVVTYRGAVYPWQCDHKGHMNVMWYVGKFDEASWQLLSQLGQARSRFSNGGKGAVALEQHINYRRELHAGDPVTIRSKVLVVHENTIHLIHEMSNDETGELAANTRIVGLFIDARLRKSCPLPADVRERALLMAEGAGGLHIDSGISEGPHEDAKQPSPCLHERIEGSQIGG